MLQHSLVACSISGNQSAYLVWAKSLCVIEAWIS